MHAPSAFAILFYVRPDFSRRPCMSNGTSPSHTRPTRRSAGHLDLIDILISIPPKYSLVESAVVVVGPCLVWRLMAGRISGMGFPCSSATISIQYRGSYPVLYLLIEITGIIPSKSVNLIARLNAE